MSAVEKRIRLGCILLDLRNSKSISGRELARRTGIPQSHISKFENGKLSPSRQHIRSIATALKLSASERQRLLSWSRLLDHEFAPFLLNSDAQLAENQQIIRVIETSTMLVRGYQQYVIPGLLQTRQYMEAIFTSTTDAAIPVNKAAISKAIDARIERQVNLSGADKKFAFLFHETTFFNQLGSRKVMKEQLQHLLKLSDFQNLSLGFLPARSIWQGEMPVTSFDVFDRDLALVECHAGLLYLWMPKVIENYIRMFESLWFNALTGAAFRKEIERLLDIYQ